jgi:DNA modification methylase
MTARLIHGDVLAGLRSLDAGSVRCVVTSPPYWGLRDYGIDGQLGLEQTADADVAALVGVFRKYLDLAVARIGPMLTTVEDVGPGRTPADAQPETKEADGG